MPEISQITFSHQELAEILVRQQGLHEGIWALYVEFGMVAANLGSNKTDVLPSAILSITKIGLNRAPEVTAVSVDAAQVNAVQVASATSSAKTKK